MKTDRNIFIAIMVVVCLIIIIWITQMYRLSKECAAKGGVLVQGAMSYVCVPAAGEKK